MAAWVSAVVVGTATGWCSAVGILFAKGVSYETSLGGFSGEFFLILGNLDVVGVWLVVEMETMMDGGLSILCWGCLSICQRG